MTTCCCTQAAAVVGALTLTYLAVKALNFIRANVLAKSDLKQRYAKVGSWAVVTGASDGIGEAMAIDLAKRGFNVAVIARTKSKLDDVVKRVEGMKGSPKGLAIVFDFSTADDAAYAALFAQLSKLDIAILVNNVGINYNYADYFAERPVEEDLKLLKVNCESMVRMTKFVVPLLQAKRGGGIVNLSSFTATAPAPMLATYAGTKSFALGFSEALAAELKPFGIDVLTVTPNLVASAMTQGVSDRKPKTSFLLVAAAPMARQTLNKLGAGVTRTAGHFNHNIIEAILTSLPSGLLSSKIYGMHKVSKKKAEKKLAEGKK